MTDSTNKMSSNLDYNAILESLKAELTARALGKTSTLPENQVQKLKNMQNELRELGLKREQEALKELRTIARENFAQHCLLPTSGGVDSFGKVGEFTVIVLSPVNEFTLEQMEKAMTLSEKFPGVKVTTRLTRTNEEHRHMSCTHCS